MPQQYTTGDVAMLCRVAPRTVVKWFEEEGLEGARAADGKTRLIPRRNLVKFLRDKHISLHHTLIDSTNRLLLLSHHTILTQALADVLQGEPCRICRATTPSEAREFVQEGLGQFCWAVIDATCRAFNAEDICRRLIAAGWTVVLLTDRKQPRMKGVADTFYFPFDTPLLVERLRSLINS